MSSNIATIRAALETYLAATSGIPALVFDNVDYDPSALTPFVRVKLAPVSRRPIDVGPNPLSRVDGIYILTICQPKNVGDGPGLVVADTLSNRFPPHSVIPYGSIFVEIVYSEVGMSYPDDLYHCTPVTIGWFAHN
jgi:hypothetical protein